MDPDEEIRKALEAIAYSLKIIEKILSGD